MPHKKFKYRARPAGIEIEEGQVLLHFSKVYEMDEAYFIYLLRMMLSEARRNPELFADGGVKALLEDVEKYDFHRYGAIVLDMGMYFATADSNRAFLECLRFLGRKLKNDPSVLDDEAFAGAQFLRRDLAPGYLLHYLNAWIQMHEEYGGFVGVKTLETTEPRASS